MQDRELCRVVGVAASKVVQSVGDGGVVKGGGSWMVPFHVDGAESCVVQCREWCRSM